MLHSLLLLRVCFVVQSILDSSLDLSGYLEASALVTQKENQHRSFNVVIIFEHSAFLTADARLTFSSRERLSYPFPWSTMKSSFVYSRHPTRHPRDETRKLHYEMEKSRIE